MGPASQTRRQVSVELLLDPSTDDTKNKITAFWFLGRYSCFHVLLEMKKKNIVATCKLATMSEFT
jgi:hypothetical protein